MRDRRLRPLRRRAVAALAVVLLLLLGLQSTPTVPAAAAPGGGTAGDPRPLDTALARWVDAAHYETGRLDLSEAAVDGKAPVRDGDQAIVLSPGSELTLPINVAAAGRYVAALEYAPVDARVTDADLTLAIDTDEHRAVIPLLWQDIGSTYLQDPYGNDLLPEQRSVTGFVINPLLDAQSAVSKQVLVLDSGAGRRTLRLRTVEQGLRIRAVYLAPQSEAVPYGAYAASQPAGSAADSLITIEGEAYAAKTDSFIRGTSVKDPALSPYDTYVRRLNVIDGNSWSAPGQKIAWEFDVGQAGWYQIALCYAQTAGAGKPSYRRVEIDGRLLFDAMEAVSFPPTSGSQYTNLVLADDSQEPYRFYLEPGRHVIALTVTLGAAQAPYSRLLAIMQQINDVAADIRSVTGGVSDKNRTWDMEAYFPDVIPRLEQAIADIDSVYAELKAAASGAPAYANELLYAADILRQLIAKPPTLPNKIALLAEGDQAANKYLGNMLTALVKQPLSIDRIYLFGDTQSPPPAQVSFFRRLGEGLRSFFYSFLPSATQADYAASTAKDGEELQVWINRPVQYVQVLQQLLDADYNQKHGTNIRLSVMRDEQKMILSNAAGTNPDVCLGVSYQTPYDFAIRGAARNLLEFEEFLPFYDDNYNLASLAPMCFQDGVYGAAETVDFQVLFYRKDILASLGLTVPDTWDDVKRIMPVLLQKSLNFSTPIATQGGFKTYNSTSPFIFQHGGRYLAADGASAALKTDATYDGLTAMTELYAIYGAQMTVANFYNSFRFGQTPIGIGGFSTYLQMKVAAPELTGKWGIALVPGERQADGSVWRYQMADSTACMIFQKSEKGEQAWPFLRWWLSAETQTQFSYLLESTLGPEYRWNTANLKAFAQLPYPKEDREVILGQLAAQKEVVRHPANYMLEREVSNVWNNTVVNGKPLIDAVDKAQLNIDREIRRKLEEFGFIDADGRLLITYETEPIERLRALLGKGD